MTSTRWASEAKLSGTFTTPLATIIDKNPTVNIFLALITPSLWFEVHALRIIPCAQQEDSQHLTINLIGNILAID